MTPTQRRTLLSLTGDMPHDPDRVAVTCETEKMGRHIFLRIEHTIRGALAPMYSQAWLVGPRGRVKELSR